MSLPADWWRWEKLGGFIALILIALTIGMFKPQFLSEANLLTILRQASPLLLAAIAQTVIVMSGEIDLSQGSAAALVSMLTVMAAKSIGTGPAILLGLLVGATLGCINGLVVTKLKVPAFIATVGMLTYAQGLALYLGGGVPIEFPPASFTWLGQGYVGPIPVAAIVALLALLAVHLIINRTMLGRHLKATGGNRTAARLSGVNIERTRLVAFIIGGTLLAISAIILSSRVSSGQPYLYPPLPFEAIAALAVGGIALRGGEGSMHQVLLGVLIFSTMSNALNFFALSSYVQQMITGAITILALLLAYWQTQNRRPAKVRGSAPQRAGQDA